MNETQPVVSVLMLAHDHASFIGQAIDSIVTQQSSYPFELLIGEDCSSDNTLSICLEYQARYPGLVRVVAHDRNVGMHANFQRLWGEAKGEFIAFCEGDDYWTDSHKLNKQVSFFQQRSECSLCGTFTNILAQQENGEWVIEGTMEPCRIQETYSFKDLIPDYAFHFSSVMVRKAVVVFPDWFTSVYCVDRPLYLLATQNGDAGLLPEATSVYRLHQGGNWSSLEELKRAQNSTDLFIKMRDHFDKQLSSLFEQTLSSILWSYMSEAMQNNQLQVAKEIYWKSLEYAPFIRLKKKWAPYLKVFLRLYMPVMRHVNKVTSIV